MITGKSSDLSCAEKEKVDCFLYQAESSDESTRNRSLNELSSLNNRLVPYLIGKMAVSRDRIPIINLLAELDLKESAKSILNVFQNGTDSEKNQSAIALGKLKYRPSIPFFLAEIEDDNSNCLFGVVTALGLLQDESAIRPLINLLPDGTYDVDTNSKGYIPVIIPDPRTIGLLETIVESLEQITGVKFGSNRDEWERWFKGVYSLKVR